VVYYNTCRFKPNLGIVSGCLLFLNIATKGFSAGAPVFIYFRGYAIGLIVTTQLNPHCSTIINRS